MLLLFSLSLDRIERFSIICKAEKNSTNPEGFTTYKRTFVWTEKIFKARAKEALVWRVESSLEGLVARSHLHMRFHHFNAFLKRLGGRPVNDVTQF